MQDRRLRLGKMEIGLVLNELRHGDVLDFRRAIEVEASRTQQQADCWLRPRCDTWRIVRWE
jgi:hypothetical protein